MIIIAPKITIPSPNKRNGECLRFKMNFSMLNVNKGAKVPRNVALAMVVNFIDPKKRAKCMPSMIPANRVLFNCLLFNGVCFLIILINHKINAPKLILQNEMVTAGTLSRNLAMIGDVLTDSIAMNKNSMILNFNLKALLQHVIIFLIHYLNYMLEWNNVTAFCFPI